MGKMYLKLGEKADSFYDAGLHIDLNSKGKVVEIENIAPQASKLLKEALAGGHVVKATKDEFDEYQESLEKPDTAGNKSKKKSKPAPAASDDDDEDEEEEDEDDDSEDEDPNDMTNSELKSALDEYELTEDEKKGLSKMNKAELVALYKKYVKDEE